MEALRKAAEARGIALPLNLGLNDGTYMPAACIDVLQRNAHRLGLRNYTTANNDPLREVIAEIDGVTPEHVFLRNGSGPILKQVVPHIIKSSIKGSTRRVMRHLVNKNGFPIITPKFTYSKVPKKASELGLTVHLVELGPENGWTLDVAEIERRRRRKETQDRSLEPAYLASPIVWVPPEPPKKGEWAQSLLLCRRRKPSSLTTNLSTSLPSTSRRQSFTSRARHQTT